MKLTICDRCKKPIEDKPIKIVIGRYGEKQKRVVNIDTRLNEVDLCESCAKEMIENVTKTPSQTVSPAIQKEKEQIKVESPKVDKMKVIDMIIAGARGTVIEKELGVKQSRISQIKTEYIEKELEGLDLGKIKALRAAGWKLSDIAIEMKTSEVVISKALNS